MILCGLTGVLIRTGRPHAGNGCVLEVRVSGVLTAQYDTSEDRTVSIKGDHGSVNIVRIRDGQVVVEDASCPNRLCVKHAPITKPGEQIICLPNRVTLTLTDREEKEAVDAISR